MNGGMHICVDMQRMFAEDTPWHAPWLRRILPAVVALSEKFAAHTIFTRFIPPEDDRSAPGAWQRVYARWPDMIRDRLNPELIELVPSLGRLAPPALLLDKPTYSPWLDGRLHQLLQMNAVRTVLISGGETDVCVLATLLGAIDYGYKVVLAEDALYGSADQTHDAILTVYRSRFQQQLTVCSTEDVLTHWDDLVA
ncbi:cysteine hydrolase family protein [Devosia salina]|uniref:Cysteine hydrolase n=1 Tax=Devosia salina TaxID=2860336 RepID=A0ABX8WBI7_9HYPH|nr:isochorismatase family cysteine hydrolase [Devosia salina]QYO76076.1 cysteine hydrolase [Devosia salina]